VVPNGALDQFCFQLDILLIQSFIQVAEASILEQNVVHPSHRFLYPVHLAIPQAVKYPELSQCELDIHADTFVAGSNTRLISMAGKAVTLPGFIEGVAMNEIPIASICHCLC
jgi:hypothetical protein